MFRIQHIRIRNFRCLREVDFDLSQASAWVMFGPNGSGKTSVIEACQLALGLKVGREPPKGQDYSIEVAIPGYTIRREPGRHEVVPDQNQLDLPEIPFDGRFTVKGRKAQPWETFQSLNFPSWRAPILKSSVDLSVGRGRRPDKNSENALVRLQQYYVNMLGLRGLSGYSTELKYQRLHEAWKKFYPRDTGAFVTEPVEDVDLTQEDVDVSGGFNLYYKHPKVGRIAVNEMSSGEIEILSLLGSLIIEKKMPDIVFIDEPELHLNSVWHRALIPAFREFAKDTQFVVATHSLDVWDSVLSTEHVEMERQYA